MEIWHHKSGSRSLMRTLTLTPASLIQHLTLFTYFCVILSRVLDREIAKGLESLNDMPNALKNLEFG